MAADLALALHPRHVVPAGDAQRALPLPRGVAAELGEGPAPEGVPLELRLGVGLCSIAGPAITIPLLWAEVARVGAAGILIKAAAVAEAAPPPSGAPQGFRRRAAAPVSEAWLVVAGSAEAARAALAAMGEAGAVRKDFEKEHELGTELLGSGVTAEVYRAKSLRGALSVAAKCIKNEPLQGSLAESMLTRELSILVALQGHPNIMKFHGCFVIERPGAQAPTRCLTMELCHRDLFAAVRSKAYSETSAKVTLREILGGLAHMHRLEFVHRDVKPTNVMLRADGAAVLADLGMACSINDKAEAARPCGSPGFISPEIILRRGARLNSDVWSLGAVLYFMLSKRQPFVGEDISRTLRKCTTDRVSFQHPAFDQVGEGCRNFIAAMLEPRPARRPTSSAALDSAWLAEEPMRRPSSAGLPSLSPQKVVAPPTSWAEIDPMCASRQGWKTGSTAPPSTTASPCRSESVGDRAKAEGSMSMVPTPPPGRPRRRASLLPSFAQSLRRLKPQPRLIRWRSASVEPQPSGA